ncbi:MAG: cytochrome c biogenesis protein CcsA [Candidatus Zixiibacteriota bacterium]
MGPEVPGQLAIWLALLMNLISGAAFFLVARGREELRSLATRAYYAFLGFTVLAVGCLYYAFFTHNYAFKYVAAYSERAQQPFYVLSAFWGGQEGTYLLWLLLCGFWGLLILRRGGRYTNYGMAVYSTVNLFLLFLLIKLSPFALIPGGVPADGQGLNPLLQDPWMVIHPPIMFTGFAATAVPFALALAAMIRNDYTDWTKRAFPWVATVALFLGMGNVMGGYWAYKTLGWGGYWAWDPVENTSMVPWMISLALIHGLIVEKRTGALRKSNLLLAIFLFMLVIYGTFLTRSGVLADFSVHSFTDLGINVNLIGFMAFFAVSSMAVFFWRARSIQSAPINYNYFGKEFSLVASVAVLFVFGLIVLFWSSLPILSGWFSDEPRAAEIVTYNSFAVPLAVVMAFLLTLVPHVKFSGYRLENGLQKSLVVVGSCVVIGFGLFYLILDATMVFAVMFSLVVGGMLVYLFNPEFRKPLIPALALFIASVVISLIAGVRDYMTLLFYAAAAMAAVSNLIHLAGYLPDRIRFAAAPLTHFGFGVMLVGVMASSAFDSNERLVVEQGKTVASQHYGVSVGYNGMRDAIDHPKNELLLSLDDGSGPREVRPQLYYSARMDGIMRKPYINRALAYDLYLAPMQVEEGKSGGGLALRKGETKLEGDYTFTFEEFEIGGHDEMGAAGMSVAAKIIVAHGDSAQTIAPKVIQGSGDTGVESQPAEISLNGRKYQASIRQIIADQGVVVLDIPGLLPGISPEKLILDISKKPMITLVWVGTTLILLGSLTSLYRRRTELVAADDGQ